jgi:hypothetical protein
VGHKTVYLSCFYNPRTSNENGYLEFKRSINRADNITNAFIITAGDFNLPGFKVCFVDMVFSSAKTISWSDSPGIVSILLKQFGKFVIMRSSVFDNENGYLEFKRSINRADNITNAFIITAGDFNLPG